MSHRRFDRAGFFQRATRLCVAALAFIWMGAVDFYRRVLPADGSFAVRFHHFAVSIPTGDDEWERVRRLLAASALGFDYTVVIPDRVRAGYVDTSAQLGHLIEVCQLQREDIEFFSGLVADSA